MLYRILGQEGGALAYMRIIGITGTLGAGKGTVVDFLMRPPYSYCHYSARKLLNEIIAERGLPAGRDSMRHVANELRCPGSFFVPSRCAEY